MYLKHVAATDFSISDIIFRALNKWLTTATVCKLIRTSFIDCNHIANIINNYVLCGHRYEDITNNLWSEDVNKLL